MTFALTDEQRSLAETVLAVLRDRGTGEMARDVVDEPEAWRPLWRELTDLDVPTVCVPEEFGGVGLGVVELVAICEAAGQSLAPVPLVATAGCFYPLLAAASNEDPDVEELIREITALGGSGALAWSPVQGVVTLAEDGSLRGESVLIAELGRVGHVAVVAETTRGERRVVVAPAEALLEVEIGSADPTRPLSWVNFSAEPIPGAVTLGGPILNGLLTALTATSAELVGLGSEIVRVTVAYALERKQFGRPIGSFQAVKHHLVNAHLAVEAARSLVYRAAVLLDADAPRAELERAVYQARGSAGEAAMRCARVGVQVHGGIGITYEHDMSLMYLRARQASALWGDSDFYYARAGEFELPTADHKLARAAATE